MNLPTAFIHNIRCLLGHEEADKLLSALQTGQPISIRLNNRLETLSLPAGTLSVPWCATGYYLNERPTFTFDPLFHAGGYYVQEAASMFLEQALKQYVDSPVLMLDLCAAPGGKSTLARSVLPAGSLLVANEVMRNRSQILAENVAKWGHPDVVVTNNDPADFAPLTQMFDVILADVPCSGEGMFRKDEVAIQEWSPENVNICWQRQRRILSDIWPCLKPGGILIYSTCTYNTQENEENVRWIAHELGAEVLPLLVEDGWGITGNLLPDASFPVYRFLPHKTAGEGLFLAVLRKEGQLPVMETAVAMKGNARSQVKGKREKGKPSQPTFTKEQLNEAACWIATNGYELLPVAGTLTAFPRQWLNEYTAFQSARLRILHAGCPVAEVKGRDLLPQHPLAMSSLLRPDAFHRIEVSYEQAIAYLRKEAILLPPDTPRGYLLLTYRLVPIGFVKNIGNRANNLYPPEWRIRTSHLPEEIRLFV
ncbi:MAG: rRNA cytosine-C5-methyltransferase [Mediterranea massiliensis]|nr:rRNA cytosine-C5-methyltransferase [Mediterranea massiliensis]